jgi:hypothetical protein
MAPRRSAVSQSCGQDAAEAGGPMTTEQLAQLVTRTLYEVTPDLKGEPMGPKARFGEQSNSTPWIS